jgi:O-antigen/teichoic acid export membrane protein
MKNAHSTILGRLFAQPSVLEQDGKPAEDLTGRDRLVSNVIFSWAAHFVFLVAGFILPRMIDHRLGQEMLGVWDFAWSLVSYFTIVQAGIGSSVNRYVARYQAAGDMTGVSRIVSSASFILAVSGTFVLGLTIAVSLLLPELFGNRLGENVSDAQWVVFFLGASIVIEITFSAFSGALTGYHRWGLHNLVTSGWHAATVAVMIIALLRGGSLPSLAVITFVGVALTYMTRVILVHWVCEGLRLRLSMVGWLTIRRLFVFGGKSLIPSVSDLLLNQTTSILIVAYLGPSILALYARPRSLMHHAGILVNKMAMILVPTSSSLQSTRDFEGIRGLLIKSVRYSFYMVLPIVLVMTVFGGPIMQLWMGPRYANGLVPAVLATGYLATLVQAPVLMILMGMNAHGRAGMAQLVASLCSAGLTVLALGYLRWGIAGAAVAITLPLTVMNAVYLPRLVCRRVGLDIRRYFLSVTVWPAVHVLPFAICLVGARLLFHTEPLIGLLWGGSVGGAILAVIYCRYVIPDQIRMWASRFLKMKGPLESD